MTMVTKNDDDDDEDYDGDDDDNDDDDDDEPSTLIQALGERGHSSPSGT